VMSEIGMATFFFASSSSLSPFVLWGTTDTSSSGSAPLFAVRSLWIRSVTSNPWVKPSSAALIQYH
jgi:hypothetical protein